MAPYMGRYVKFWWRVLRYEGRNSTGRTVFDLVPSDVMGASVIPACKPKGLGRPGGPAPEPRSGAPQAQGLTAGPRLKPSIIGRDAPHQTLSVTSRAGFYC